MVKKVVIVSILAIVMFSLRAEARGGLVNFGIKGGYTSEAIKFKGASHGDYNLSTNNRGGFHVGLMSRINLFSFHIQPELLYSRTSYRVGMERKDGSMPSVRSTVKLQTVDVPVMFGLKMLWFRFQAGPMFTILTDSSSGSTPSVDVFKPTVSFLLGLGFDIQNINLDVRYNGQFKRPEQNVQMEAPQNINHDYRSKMNRWMFSVGYMF